MRFLLFVLLLGVAACNKDEKLPPIDHEVDLDGNRINDSSLLFPSQFLQSAKSFHEIEEDVVIAVHGFSASNFEWLEFHSFCRGKEDVNVSRVLLGGHGRDYSDFKAATWEDWQRPVIEEYKKLRLLGYKHIHFIAASTGCPLVLEMLASGKIDPEGIGNLFLIDPIVVPSNKQLSLAPALAGTVIHYTESGLEPGELGRWYAYRPAFALKQLDRLTRLVRKKLEKGMDLPLHIRTFVYKSEHDASADPVSAVIIENGLERCETKMMSTGLHVFTRLAGRYPVSDRDIALQQTTFEEIYSRITAK